MSRSWWETREDMDGFAVSYVGNLVAFFKKADGWTRELVEEAVRKLKESR